LHNQKPHYKRWVQIAVLHHLNGIGDALERNEFLLLYKMLRECKIIDHTEDFKLSLRLQNIINIIGFSQALYNGYLRNVANDLYRKYLLLDIKEQKRMINEFLYHIFNSQEYRRNMVLCEKDIASQQEILKQNSEEKEEIEANLNKKKTDVLYIQKTCLEVLNYQHPPKLAVTVISNADMRNNISTVPQLPRIDTTPRINYATY
jgi:hypothetical protein